MAKQTVSFHYADVLPVRFSNKTSIKEFIVALFKKEKVQLSHLSYVFCSDEYLLQMNRDFLQHDYYTDIITFDLSEGNGVIGEVYVSIDRVKDNALKHNVSWQEELLRVLFHGALHLSGYKDKTKSEIMTMRKKEDQYLSLYARHQI